MLVRVFAKIISGKIMCVPATVIAVSAVHAVIVSVFVFVASAAHA